jgi:hypothetical protein
MMMVMIRMMTSRRKIGEIKICFINFAFFIKLKSVKGEVAVHTGGGGGWKYSSTHF